MKLDVGVIGVGIMGGAMAANLLGSGHQVTGYDTDRSRLEELAEGGLIRAGSASEAASRSEILILSLPSPSALQQVTEELAGSEISDVLCLEAGTFSLEDKFAARDRLADAGIAVGVGMAPILPGLSDRPEQLREVVRAARAAGARSIWASLLHLRSGTREHFLEALARDWPEELGRYERLYAGRAYLPASVSRPVQETVREATRGAPLRHVPSPKRQRAPELPQLRLAV